MIKVCWASVEFDYLLKTVEFALHKNTWLTYSREYGLKNYTLNVKTERFYGELTLLNLICTLICQGDIKMKAKNEQ